jgi:hypothetical protein
VQIRKSSTSAQTTSTAVASIFSGKPPLQQHQSIAGNEQRQTLINSQYQVPAPETRENDTTSAKKCMADKDNQGSLKIGEWHPDQLKAWY